VPSWHATEGVGLIPGGTTDIQKVLNLGGINWTLDSDPVYRKVGRKFEIIPDKFALSRSDNHDYLATVGKIYTGINPVQQLQFLQDLAERYDVVFESAGPLNGGRQVFVSMKVPEGITIDAEGINDYLDLFFGVINYNDGHGKMRAVVSPWRPLCGNTNRFMLRDAISSWGVAHTKSAPERIAEAQRELGLIFDYREQFAVEETKLAQTELAIGEVEALMAELWEAPGKDATNRAKLAHARRTDTLHELWELESGRVGPSAYALEQVATGMIDNHKNRNAGRNPTPADLAARRGTAALLGEDDTFKTDVHARLLTLSNR
jgi:phage/plasmid-like protein (TIGR03299 family)